MIQPLGQVEAVDQLDALPLLTAHDTVHRRDPATAVAGAGVVAVAEDVDAVAAQPRVAGQHDLTAGQGCGDVAVAGEPRAGRPGSERQAGGKRQEDRNGAAEDAATASSGRDQRSSPSVNVGFGEVSANRCSSASRRIAVPVARNSVACSPQTWLKTPTDTPTMPEA